LNKPIGKEINPIVRQLFKVHQGSKAWNIFKEFLHDSETEWISCKEYIEKYLGNLSIKDDKVNQDNHTKDSYMDH